MLFSKLERAFKVFKPNSEVNWGQVLSHGLGELTWVNIDKPKSLFFYKTNKNDIILRNKIKRKKSTRFYRVIGQPFFLLGNTGLILSIFL